MTDDTDDNAFNDAFLNAEIKRLDADLERMAADTSITTNELPELDTTINEAEMQELARVDWSELEKIGTGIDALELPELNIAADLKEITSRPGS